MSQLDLGHAVLFWSRVNLLKFPCDVYLNNTEPGYLSYSYYSALVKIL
jgi:hypothetical protein